MSLPEGVLIFLASFVAGFLAVFVPAHYWVKKSSSRPHRGAGGVRSVADGPHRIGPAPRSAADPANS